MRAALALLVAVVLAVGGSPGVWAGEEVIGQGRFVGKSGHKTSGGVRLVRTDTGVKVVLEGDFRFDGAPDPKVGLGRGGYDKSAKLSALRKNRGEQSYDLPASLDPARYDEVWVWCEQYAVPLGFAKLK
jgi:hypothetical protein